MKHINFVDKNMEGQVKKFELWFKLSGIAFILLIVILGVAQAYKYSVLRAVTREHERLNNEREKYQEICEQKKNLESQAQLLHDKLSLLNDFKQQTATIIEQVAALQAIDSKDLVVLSCTLHEKSATITVEFSSIETLQHCVANMIRTNVFKQVIVQSITKTKGHALQAILEV